MGGSGQLFGAMPNYLEPTPHIYIYTCCMYTYIYSAYIVHIYMYGLVPPTDGTTCGPHVITQAHVTTVLHTITRHSHGQLRFKATQIEKPCSFLFFVFLRGYVSKLF